MSTTTLLTFAEFEQLPDRPGKQELIEGELIEMPPPMGSHSYTARQFRRLLESGSVDRDLVFDEAGFKLSPDSYVQPDVCVLWPAQAGSTGYFPGAPMLAIEILSDHKSAQYVQDKLELYFAHGAREVWVVSRKRRSVTVHQRDENGAITATRVTDEYTPDWLGVAVRPAELIIP
jgi:Uma2 family endonuclease